MKDAEGCARRLFFDGDFEHGVGGWRAGFGAGEDDGGNGGDDDDHAGELGGGEALAQEERAELAQSFLGRITRLPPLALSETLRQSRAAERALLRSFKSDLGAFAEFLTDDYLGKGLRAVIKGESPKF